MNLVSESHVIYPALCTVLDPYAKSNFYVQPAIELATVLARYHTVEKKTTRSSNQGIYTISQAVQRMEGSKVCFVTFAFYTVCSAYCPSSHLTYKDCSTYYNEVEGALLENQYNKYQLHEEFFPSSHSAPLYGYVLYTNLTENGSTYDVCIPWSNSVLLAYIDPFVLNNLQLRLMEFLFATTGVHYLSNLDNYFSGPGELCYQVLNESAPSKYHVTIVQLNLTLDLKADIPYEAAKVILMDLTSWVSIQEYLTLPQYFHI